MSLFIRWIPTIIVISALIAFVVGALFPELQTSLK